MIEHLVIFTTAGASAFALIYVGFLVILDALKGRRREQK
jgi:hypothetical protein